MKRLMALLLVFLMITMSLQGVFAVDAETPSQNALEERLSETVLLYLGSNLARVRGTLAPIDVGRNGTAPFLHENRTMVPIRFLAESVGGVVTFDAPTGTATITIEQYVISARDGDKNLRINGIPIEMEVAPITRNGRMYAPLRAISEAFGMGVFYDRGLIAIAPGPVYLNATTHKALIDEQIRALGMVQVAKTEADLLAQIKAWQSDNTRSGYDSEFPPMLTDESVTQSESDAKTESAPQAADGSTTAPNAEPESAPSPDSIAGQDGHSTTNIQVAGVDEGDILKTDGTYLYQINRMRVLIIRAQPADRMALLATIQLGAENVFPEEIYLADGRLTIIGSQSHYNYPMETFDAPMTEPSVKSSDASANEPSVESSIVPSIESSDTPSVAPSIGVIRPPVMPMPAENTTRVVTYDVSDPYRPERLSSYEIEGRLLSSRRVGSALYLVTNKSLYYRYQYQDAATPVYRYGSGANEGTWQKIAPTTVSWCPDFMNANYLVVSGIQLDKPSQVPSLYTLLGAGETIYATENALFVAVQQYRRGPVMLPEPMIARMPPSYAESTDIYRFTLDAGAATLVSRGSIPGRLLNQFSMDWHESHLRVATTLGWASQTGEPTSTNQLYTLDEMMNVKGAILDIAPGEQIYSTRFLGDRGYMVTYRNVDPLYVLDLADPAKPAILGELKIPGYSNYLHPYQDGYLIGFGKDSVELASKWDSQTTWAYYQGLKVALFDVTDVTKPKLMHETHIGDRGTDSELLSNHRALLFSPTRNLLAFPVSLHEVKAGEDALTAYGSFTWQGLMAYRLTLEKGFEKLADISHLEPGDYWNSERYVTRGAYIGNTLYTLSNREIRATSMETWKESGRLILP